MAVSRSLGSRFGAPLLLAAVAALGTAGCGEDADSSAPVPVPQPTPAQFDAAGLGQLPVAPDSARVDLTAPPFSNPTEVTNPLFPISELHSAVLNGGIDGKPFHTETTLLPYTRTIEWAPGQTVETRISQYMAFLDGRLQEVALDYYAQADDGSVWYFGEDVADYNPHGLIAYTTDSWLAGEDGPPAMIMPGDPTVGQAFRTENIPGQVFEEVTVKQVDKTIPGPPGPVEGAMVGSELHDDAQRSDKVFAPGYGEFLTRDSDGIEAMALAVPTDALDKPTPGELESIRSGAVDAFDAIRSNDWAAASTAARPLQGLWDRYAQTGEAPPRLQPPIEHALAELARAIAARDQTSASTASIYAAQAALDLELRYRPTTEIDLARFELWDRQLIVDAQAGDMGGVTGDLATMEWTRDRFAQAIDPTERTEITAGLLALRESVQSRGLGAARTEARLLGALQRGSSSQLP